MVRYCKSRKCLVGKTAIITGCNTGIGYETALDFAKRGCRVIMACRNQEKAEEARDKLVKATGNKNIIVKIIDLGSLESVRQFAKDVIGNEPRLDILVNNAGALFLPNEITSDGLQLEMATNYFSSFLLTILLLDLLKKTAPSRIINVSSSLAKAAGSLNLEKLNEYNGTFKLYAKSKLCQIYFTQELAKRLQGTNVTAYSVHPGAVNTEYARYSKTLTSQIMTFFSKRIYMSPEKGAQTSIFVSIEDGLEDFNGQLFADCKPSGPYYNAQKAEIQTKLWEISEQMVGLSSKVTHM